jgi:hypothetical protein
VAVVVLLAVALVTLRSVDNDPAVPVMTPTAAVSPRMQNPVAGPPLAAGAVPRYYVTIGGYDSKGRSAIIVGDRQTGATLGSYPLHSGGSLFSTAVSGAADNRTFVVSSAPSWGKAGPPWWYLVRIVPGSADPVRVTQLKIDYPAAEGVRQLGLSADGTQLAVASITGGATPRDNAPLALEVYSVTTGQLRHSWSTGFKESSGNEAPVAGLSWVGDRTLAFTVTRSPEVREEVRTLDIGKTGNNLMADSRLVWSQYVPAAPHGDRHGAHACDTPVLTGDGTAVVCGNGSYSAGDKRMTAVWLAYPLATPTRPRVIGSIIEPPRVSNFNGPVSVDWVNPSGTMVIGSWNTSAGVTRQGQPATEVVNYTGVIANGKVKPFPRRAFLPSAW